MKMRRRERGSDTLLAALTVLVVCLSGASNAAAIPASGPHETVELTTSTTLPNTAAALNYSATYRNPADPHSDPPALRRLVISLPTGTRIDTAVQARCIASDQQIRLLGDSACPPASREGTGQATVDVVGAGRMMFNTTLFNAPEDSLEIIESGAPVGANGVLHTYVHGTTLDGPVSTCISGGQPPDGCPTDQVIALANHLTVLPYSVGNGINKRSSSLTPPSCPSSRFWTSPVTFYYADGTVETVITRQPCQSASTGSSAPTHPGGANGGMCLSKRRFPIHLHWAGIHLRSIVVEINGRRHSYAARHVIVDLRGLRKGPVTVRIIATTTTGRRIVETRRFRTCVPDIVR